MAARVDLHSAAVRFAARGWAVLPCHTPVNGGCSCSKTDCSAPGKHPRLVNGLNGASTDRAAIEQWWNRWPEANLGIRTGEASGLVVVDIDRRSGGDRTLSQLVDQHDKLPSTLAVRTGDGVHLYFAHPGWPVRNDAGRRLGPGIDVRGEGGYVLAPPSLHALRPSLRSHRRRRTPGDDADLDGRTGRVATRVEPIHAVGSLCTIPPRGHSRAHQRSAGGGASGDWHTQCESQPSRRSASDRSWPAAASTTPRSSERYSTRRWRPASATAKRAPRIASGPERRSKATTNTATIAGPDTIDNNQPTSWCPDSDLRSLAERLRRPQLRSAQRLRRAVLDQRARPNLGDGAPRHCATARVRRRSRADRHRTARPVSRCRRRRPSLGDATHTRSSRTVRPSHCPPRRFDGHAHRASPLRTSQLRRASPTVRQSHERLCPTTSFTRTLAQ